MHETNALNTVADLMCLSARTAPKTRGVDVLLAAVLTGGDKDKVADEMERIGGEQDQAFFVRDAGCLRDSPVCVVLAARSKPAGLHVCGYCGSESCAANAERGGTCAFNHIDLGIAASSAVGVAALHHADCRMMYTVGRAAIELSLFGEPVVSAIGIPLSATGKNPFFDRKPPKAD